MIRLIRSMWARLAISGTTPRNFACRSFWLATTLLSTSLPPASKPAAVSSQEVSIPSTTSMTLLLPKKEERACARSPLILFARPQTAWAWHPKHQPWRAASSPVPAFTPAPAGWRPPSASLRGRPASRGAPRSPWPSCLSITGLAAAAAFGRVDGATTRSRRHPRFDDLLRLLVGQIHGDVWLGRPTCRSAAPPASGESARR